MEIIDFDYEGKSTLRAFRKGVIPGLIARGNDLNRAVKIAMGLGLCVRENTVHNIVVTQAKVLLAMFLNNEAVTGINYHALGLGADIPNASDTLLQVEATRKLITSASRSGTSIILSAYYTAAQSTFNIKEGGIFCNGATGTANSGTLFSHFSQSEDNSAGLNDLTFEYAFRIK